MSTTTLDPRQAHPSAGPAPRRPDALTARRPPLARLTTIELRKAVNTRSGRVLLLAVIGIGLAGLGWRVVQADESPVSFEHFIGTSMFGVALILPVIGVMAMTAEWTQRTALSTFTTTARRGRVITAKVGAAVVLGAFASVALLAAGALATLLGAAITGTDASWDGAGKLAAGLLVANTLNLLMAVGFGALIPQTAAAVTVFLVMPTLWASAGVAILKDRAEWFNVYGAFDRLSHFEATDLPQTLTSIGTWIVLPLAVGTVTSLRREVK